MTAMHCPLLQSEHGTKGLFVDTGVYTRNRAFRLYLSSKAGKQAILQPTGQRMLPANQAEPLSNRLSRMSFQSHEAPSHDGMLCLTARLHKSAATPRQTFLASLICNVPPGARLLRCCPDAESQSAAAPGTGRRQPAHAATHPAHPSCGPSPYPALEEYLTLMCREGGVQGRVRSWVAFPDIGVLLYNMRDNRWCANVGRPHKSNGVFYVVDLHQALWYQKCYDPECRSFRSESLPLPSDVAAELQAAAPPVGGAASAPGLDSDRGGRGQGSGGLNEHQGGGAAQHVQHRYSYAPPAGGSPIDAAQQGSGNLQQHAVSVEEGALQGSPGDDALMVAAAEAYESVAWC